MLDAETGRFVPPGRDVAPPPSGRPTLEARGIGFRAGNGTWLLKDFNIALRPGQVLGIVGHNGSGKSTALKLLSRLLPPTCGEVLVKGQAADQLERRSFARQVAYLAQDTSDGADYTVEELVAVGRYPWQGPFGRQTSEDKEAIERALALVGLGPLSNRQVASLSGGERQRVWIAVCLAQGAACLLLDEPISALDLNHQIETLKLLVELARDEGLAVAAVLHDINLAARFCDWIVALKQGAIACEGAPETVMTVERLEDVFGIRMLISRHPAGTYPIALAE